MFLLSFIDRDKNCIKGGVKSQLKSFMICSWMDESRAVMVMLYPTRSALKMNVDDSTFFHLTQHLPEMGISELTVINLFSKVCRARMSTANLKVDEENMRFIEDTIMKRKDFKNIPFIVAWGSSMQNCKSANESKERLLKLFRKYNPKGIPQQINSAIKAYLSNYIKQKFKVFWREDTSNGKVIRHSKTMPKGATLKQAKNYLEKAEATTFRKTKYSNIGKITKSVSKDGKSRFVAIWYELDSKETFGFKANCCQSL